MTDKGVLKASLADERARKLELGAAVDALRAQLATSEQAARRADTACDELRQRVDLLVADAARTLAALGELTSERDAAQSALDAATHAHRAAECAAAGAYAVRTLDAERDVAAWSAATAEAVQEASTSRASAYAAETERARVAARADEVEARLAAARTALAENAALRSQLEHALAAANARAAVQLEDERCSHARTASRVAVAERALEAARLEAAAAAEEARREGREYSAVAAQLGEAVAQRDALGRRLGEVAQALSEHVEDMTARLASAAAEVCGEGMEQGKG